VDYRWVMEGPPPHEGRVIQLCWQRLRGLLWTVRASNSGIEVNAVTYGCHSEAMTFWFPRQKYWRWFMGKKEGDGRKYILAARALVSNGSTDKFGIDPVIGGNRPALTEFMTCCEVGDGEIRETSVLMICAGVDGIRCGLKDEDLGGWMWRTGETLAEALDSIEVALSDGGARFTGSKDNGRRKGRR
jgi:hypothetical protein